MNVVAAILNGAFLAAVSFLWWKKSKQLNLVFWPALLLKLLSGLLLGVLYTYYYTVGDTFRFFKDGAVLSQLARHDFLTYLKFLWSGDESFSAWSQVVAHQPRTLFLSKLVSVINIMTFDNYWITSLYFSLISFAATWFFVITLIRHFPNLKAASVIAFLFFPSVVFWGSGIIKESVAFASLCFLSGIFLQTWEKEKVGWVQWILAVWSVWILWNLKYYFAAVFIPVALTSYVVRFFLIPIVKPKNGWTESLLWLTVFIVPLCVASFIHPNFYPERILDVIVSNYDAFRQISHPQDMIEFRYMESDGARLMLNAPWALVSGLFRPFLWEAGNVFQVLSALENTTLIILSIVSIVRWKKPEITANRLLLLSLFIYVIVLCVFITLSTPNFGTLSRYRIGYIPYFALLVMINNPLVHWIETTVQRLYGRLVR